MPIERHAVIVQLSCGLFGPSASSKQPGMIYERFIFVTTAEPALGSAEWSQRTGRDMFGETI